MYTLLFLLHKEDTKVSFDDIDLIIKVYPFHSKDHGHERLLGSAFPIIDHHNHHH